MMVVPLKLERVVACIEYTMKDKRKKSKEMPTRIAYTYIHICMIDIIIMTWENTAL